MNKRYNATSFITVNIFLLLLTINYHCRVSLNHHLQRLEYEYTSNPSKFESDITQSSMHTIAENSTSFTNVPEKSRRVSHIANLNAKSQRRFSQLQAAYSVSPTRLSPGKANTSLIAQFGESAGLGTSQSLPTLGVSGKQTELSRMSLDDTSTLKRFSVAKSNIPVLDSPEFKTIISRAR